MNKINIFTFNFAKSEVKRWFNDNYYVSVYDTDDNNIMSFEKIEDMPYFFNQPLFQIIRAIRDNLGMLEYSGHKVKLYVYKKENEKRVVSRK